MKRKERNFARGLFFLTKIARVLYCIQGRKFRPIPGVSTMHFRYELHVSNSFQISVFSFTTTRIFQNVTTG
ncbi:hypothetical protein Y032_0468g2003 [Ancylostoma ceylanicum]|uniref:Uncharacterized protein n=1 Tax=Ancylostoma ceylanicum TaxID=53326 RepID=A0A016WX88_9BILA|nr:hypothetical protein Y032_0468g2003 [Ancylostoma ceylanicum]